MTALSRAGGRGPGLASVGAMRIVGGALRRIWAALNDPSEPRPPRLVSAFLFAGPYIMYLGLRDGEYLLVYLGAGLLLTGIGLW